VTDRRPTAGDQPGTPSATSTTRKVHVEPVMGTVVSFDLRAPFVADTVLDAACAVLHDIDRRFSLYRDDSELGLLAAGRLTEAGLSDDVRWVLAACDDLARTSGGAFDARRHRPDGVVDPSGLVKGWAVEEAVRRLDDAGATNCLVGAGGDFVARGEPEPGLVWRIGIRHPEIVDRVAAVVGIRTGAVATSGLYERGDHIRDPRTGAIPRELISMTVVGPDLTWADAYATAAFIMGIDGLGWVESHPGYGAIAITAGREVLWTATADARRIDDPSGLDAPNEHSRAAALSRTSHAAAVS
jgi:thiamine biosynthesis lipoprotein